MADGVQKICRVCGEDCAAKPRTKDPQGRYVCGPCVQRIKAKRAREREQRAAADDAAPAIGLEDAGEIDTAAIRESMLSRPRLEPCPSCGKPLEQTAVLCINCGHNRQTGRTEKSQVEKVKAAKGERTSQQPGGGGALLAAMPFVVSGGYLLVLGGLGAMGLATRNEELMLSFALGAIFLNIGIKLWAVLDAGRQSGTVTGLVVFIVPLAELYWSLFVTRSMTLRLTYLAHIVVVALAIVTLIQLDSAEAERLEAGRMPPSSMVAAR